MCKFIFTSIFLLFFPHTDSLASQEKNHVAINKQQNPIIKEAVLGSNTINFDSSLEKLEAILAIVNSSESLSLKKEIYLDFLNYYKLKGDFSNYEHYQKKYIDILAQESDQKLITFFLVIYMLTILVFLFFIRKLIKQKKKVSEVVNKTDIAQPNLVYLAAKDPQTFYKEFIAKYSSFDEVLIQMFEELTLKDLETLKYMFFNYNTKEIAQYTSYSVKAVENRKYRIRKKMNMSGDKEIFLWLNTQFPTHENSSFS